MSLPAGRVSLALRIWPVSARTPAALAAQADRLHQHLIDHPDLDLTDVAYSLATTRTQHPYRAAITCTGSTARIPARICWRLWARWPPIAPHPGLTSAHHLARRAGKTVFVLPGQGAQYPGMGAQLYRHHRVFAAALDEVCAALDPHLDVALREVMFAEPHSASAELLDQTAYAQPALFAWGVAMHAVFTEAGITPDYLLGHSIGELTAAYLAGVLSLADAAVLVSARGRLMQACRPGAMIAIQASEHDVAAMLRRVPGRGDRRGQRPHLGGGLRAPPTSCTCSVNTAQRAVTKSAALRGQPRLPFSGHGPGFARIRRHRRGPDLRSPSVPILSNLTGAIATPDNSPTRTTGPDTCVNRSGSMTVSLSCWPPGAHVCGVVPASGAGPGDHRHPGRCGGRERVGGDHHVAPRPARIWRCLPPRWPSCMFMVIARPGRPCIRGRGRGASHLSVRTPPLLAGAGVGR